MRLHNIFISVTVILIPVIIFAGQNPVIWDNAHSLYMKKCIPTIKKKLNSFISSLNEDAAIPIWVFFTDKGVFDQAEYNSRLSLSRANLSPAAYNRRLKARGSENLVDFRDLDVNRDYIDSVLNTGAGLRNELKWFNAVTVNALPDQIKIIASFPFVRYVKSVAYSKVDYDVKLKPISPEMRLVSLDYGASLGQLNQINLITAHELGFKGQDVIICMMDTGYRQGHDTFQNIINDGRLLAQYDFINGDYNTDYDPAQDWSSQPNHGTLTWSTLGGESEGDLYGPSYMASFILCKTEDVSSERHIEEDNWAAGAQWAESMGASVISSSLSYRWFDPEEGDYSYEDLDGNTTIVTIAADLAAYNGIAVANSAGNAGSSSGSIGAPTDADSLIACGAVNSDGELASFSSRGPTYDGRIKPEVCAQGVSTVCADPNDYGGYGTASGTSLSAPLIGGACGILFSAHPNWTGIMVREALMATADRFDQPGNDYGWGIVDIGRALYYNPETDIIFIHTPVLIASENHPIAINASVYGGADINNVYLYYRVGNSGAFSEIAMETSNGEDFTGEIPGMSGNEIQYYLKAVDTESIYAFHPLGEQMHPIKINLNSNLVSDSFEDGQHLWNAGGTNNFWGVCSYYAYTGNLCISDSPITLYRNNTDSWLESAFVYDLSDTEDAVFSFKYRGTLELNHDFLYLEVSVDGGENWNTFPDAITGSFPDFVEYSVSLNDYAGNSNVRFRFHLVTDGSGCEEGIYIDDIFIMSQTPVPTLTEWGMIILALLLLAAGSITVIRKHRTACNC